MPTGPSATSHSSLRTSGMQNAPALAGPMAGSGVAPQPTMTRTSSMDFVQRNVSNFHHPDHVGISSMESHDETLHLSETIWN